MDLITMLILAVLGLGVAVVIAWQIQNWPWLAWALVFMFVVTTSDAAPQPILRFGETSIFPEDVAGVLLILVGMMSLPSVSRGLESHVWVPILLVSIFVVNLALGYVQFGTSAIVELRPFLYFFAALLWALSIDWHDVLARRLFRRWLYICAWTLVAIAGSHMAKSGIASSSDFYVDSEGAFRTLRPLVASQALVVGLAGLASLHDWAQHRGLHRLLSTFAFLGTALLTQHRSVWVAVVVGVVILALRSGLATKQRIKGLLLAVGVVIMIVVTSGRLGSVTSTLQSSLATVTGPNSTLIDRTSGWDALVAESFERGPWAVFFGQPFGVGYERIGPNGLAEFYAPHNWYISIYLRAGIVGGVAFVAVLLGALQRLLRKGTGSGTLLASTMCFALAYTLPWFAAPLLGGSIVLSRPATRGPPPEQDSREAASADLESVTQRQTLARRNNVRTHPEDHW